MRVAVDEPGRDPCAAAAQRLQRARRAACRARRPPRRSRPPAMPTRAVADRAVGAPPRMRGDVHVGEQQVELRRSRHSMHAPSARQRRRDTRASTSSSRAMPAFAHDPAPAAHRRRAPGARQGRRSRHRARPPAPARRAPDRRRRAPRNRRARPPRSRRSAAPPPARRRAPRAATGLPDGRVRPSRSTLRRRTQCAATTRAGAARRTDEITVFESLPTPKRPPAPSTRRRETCRRRGPPRWSARAPPPRRSPRGPPPRDRSCASRARCTSAHPRRACVSSHSTGRMPAPRVALVDLARLLGGMDVDRPGAGEARRPGRSSSGVTARRLCGATPSTKPSRRGERAQPRRRGA